MMNKQVETTLKPPRLRLKYQKFADSILKSSTKRQAAMDAGFPQKTADKQGYRMTNNDQVIAYIAYHRNEMDLANKVTFEDVVPTLRRVRDDNEKEKPHETLKACSELAKVGRLYQAPETTNVKVIQNSLNIIMGEGMAKVIEEKKKLTRDIQVLDV